MQYADPAHGGHGIYGDGERDRRLVQSHERDAAGAVNEHRPVDTASDPTLSTLVSGAKQISWTFVTATTNTWTITAADNNGSPPLTSCTSAGAAVARLRR